MRTLMTIAFFSNFLNPHQLQFCREMVSILGNDFTFVATQPFNEKVVTTGFEDINTKYSFCLPSYLNSDNYTKAINLLKTCDTVIIGSAPEKMFKLRIKTGKLTFRYSERAFKPLSRNRYNPIALACMFKGNTIYNNKPLYMLCAGAYTAQDFRAVGAYKNKAFKWGYFPKGSDKTIDNLLKLKQKNNKVTMLWAGRMISWKHGEVALEVAKYLKINNIEFELQMIGSGVEKQNLEKLCLNYGLGSYVKFLGSLSNEKAIEQMEKADVFLATSDENEGWGAVVNEAMSCACCVVGCKSMGSVPYLISDEENGISYDERNPEEMKISVKQIVLNKEKRINLSKNAKKTIDDTWNAQTAAKNLISLVNILQNINFKEMINEGPCSNA